MAGKQILIVEDERPIREMIAYGLRRAGFDVREAEDCRDARQQLADRQPDLLLLDWMLPGQSGVALAKKLRSQERTRQLPIIMLTARAHEADKVQGLEVGADDYVTKPFSPKELVARVRALLRRRAPQLSDELIECAGLSLNPASHRLRVDPRGLTTAADIELGPTEFRLLAFFMTHPERVYSRTQLLDEVWGDHVYIEERTVDVHIRRLRAALEPCGRQGCIETVRGSGYRFHGGDV